MEFCYTHRAARQLAKLPRFVQKRIAEKMRFYASQDDPLRFAEHLTDYREESIAFASAIIVQRLMYKTDVS